MKNLLLTLTLLICASTGNAFTDFQCMTECQNKGYLYGYCQKICSY